MPFPLLPRELHLVPKKEDSTIPSCIFNKPLSCLHTPSPPEKPADPTPTLSQTSVTKPADTPTTISPPAKTTNAQTPTAQSVKPSTEPSSIPASSPQSNPASSPTSSTSVTGQSTSATTTAGSTAGGSTGSTTADAGSASGTSKVSSSAAPQTTATFVTTSNGQTQTQEVAVSPHAHPFATSSDIVFLSTTNSLGQGITVSYGLDPAQTSTSSSANTASTASSGTSVNSTSTTASGSSHAGAIAGGVVAALAVICLIVASLFFLRRRRRALRTAPSSEFLVQRQYPFTGSAQFQFQRTGSFSSPGGSVVDIRQPEGGALLTREQSPRTFNVAGEKMVLV